MVPLNAGNKIISQVFIDGLTYVLIAFFGALTAGFSTDDAAKYLSAHLLFWLRLACGTTCASLLALKIFRSTRFAEARAAKKERQRLYPASPGPSQFPPATTTSN